MSDALHQAVAIVGVGAILPDAPDAATFWRNLVEGRDSVREVDPRRWDPALFYDPDPHAPDKTYSKIGGWVREFSWQPRVWKLPIPPRVADAMDEGQRWAVSATQQVLADYGKPLAGERTAVILGNAMGGEKHYLTAIRIAFPEYAALLEAVPSFQALPEPVRRTIRAEWHARVGAWYPEIYEDTMPGELSNCTAGRIANLFDLHGANYTTDAACASALAAMSAAVDGLVAGHYDAVLTGGIDRNMGASSYVKFCKIGALSATGSRPYSDGADGFVMGEGAAMFLLRRLEDAERDGDRIYAVLRGIGASSDGRGKGITAPNPAGQKFAVERAWRIAGIDPHTASYFEGHGTSTRVGDVAELTSLRTGIDPGGVMKPGSVPVGSVKSNFGHLKGAAGAAGLLKATLALHNRVLPASIHVERPNPNFDWAASPFTINTETREWAAPKGDVRRAGVSAFGFGGTNFHVVVEEYQPGRLRSERKSTVAVSAPPSAPKRPLRGALVVGGADAAELSTKLQAILKAAAEGRAPAPAAPNEVDLRAPERVAIDYGNAAELADRAGRAIKLLAADNPAQWKALRAQGVYRGHGPAPKVAFLYTGQGSQYVNMLAELRTQDRAVAEIFERADKVMAPLLGGRPLTSFIYADPADKAAIGKAEEELRQTAITQPAILATDEALTRLFGGYGIVPDVVMGHSLGEYGALVAAGALPFEDALEAVSARGREMTRVSVADNGKMAAVFGPLAQIEKILATLDGYVVIANKNSHGQAVIGGASYAVERASAAFQEAGFTVVPLPVSHAFHTSIVAPASEPLKDVLRRLRIQAPQIPVVANVNGQPYPMHPGARDEIVDILGRQIASPVEFVKGLETLYDLGARVFVEVGPKKALHGFVEDVLGRNADVLALYANHPKTSDVIAFNQALCGLYAAGLGLGAGEQVVTAPIVAKVEPPPAVADPKLDAVARIFRDAFERGLAELGTITPTPKVEPIVVTGAALGLPGGTHMFGDDVLARLLEGEQMIDVIPAKMRDAIAQKHITRLVKSDEGARFETIDDVHDVIKLAGRRAAFDLVAEYGIDPDRAGALDEATRLAMAAGLDALRDAGVPLVLRYKTTTKGTRLPDRWMLPEALRDETGIIFASAFPGYDTFAAHLEAAHADTARRKLLGELEHLRVRLAPNVGAEALAELDHRITQARHDLDAHPHTFDRRFLFQILAMGHSQFAELVGARGPNTQVNAACASTTQAVSIADDWLRAGRCRRVLVIAADNATSDHLLEWIGAGFLASGAAATDEVVEDAATPFDRRRHGMLLGMGAAALVLETAEAARERGLQPITEVVSAQTTNSAFHGTRLDVDHIGQMMEQVVTRAEARTGVSRAEMARAMVFISHETYTPARGGSASAEIASLRRVFGASADQIVIANTKGYTGHPMGAGIEDVLAVKALETGIVPAVPNFKEPDPELGILNLSKGGAYPVRWALRLAAGFGSQIALTVSRWVATQDGRRRPPEGLGFAYRVGDRARWDGWLEKLAGRPAELEVVHRTLRIREPGFVDPKPAATTKVLGAPAAAAPPVPPVAKAAPVLSAPAPVVSAPAPVVPAPAPVAASAPVAEDPVRARVLALVTEKTGYPLDMLDPGLDLEADLGIDTVKQAELIGAIRDEWGIPRDDALKLRDYPTLEHVIGFVYAKRPELRQAVAPTPSTSAPPPVSSTSATPAAPPPTAEPVDDPVRARVLALVTEKTGYPLDMLDPGLDLEADLGIDTVKQAELIAAIRDEWGIPRDDALKLRDYPTLEHVIGFVYARRPELAPKAQAAPAAGAIPVAPAPVAPAPTAAPVDDPVRARVLALVTEKTGYPLDMLDPGLDLEADLGIDTVKQAELIAAIRDEWGIPRDDALKLRDYPTLEHVIGFVYARRPELAPKAAPTVSTSAPPSTSAPSSTSAPASVSPSTAAPPSTASTEDPVGARVLALVADKTGYPIDMLDPGLDLEADLGIDTVKQAELIAAIRDEWGIPRDDSIKLQDYPTLEHIVRFVYAKRPGLAVTPTTAPAPTPIAAPVSATPARRRVPTPVLRPAACLPTGVQLGSATRVAIASVPGGRSEAVATTLQALLEARGAQVVPLESTEAVHGVYWLCALDPVDLPTLDLAGWREALRVRVKALYATMRARYADSPFLVSATALGGLHGYGPEGATNPLGGAVTGFTKTWARERATLAKAVDFDGSATPAEIAAALVAETETDPGAVEIGHRDGRRWGIGLVDTDAGPEIPGAFGPDRVFVVTGAAGSIVSAITADLARACGGGHFYLLDLTPEPAPDDPDLRRYTIDRDGLRKDLYARLKAKGERATPAIVDKLLAGMERAQAARAAIDAVVAAGGTARWFAGDLRDPATARAAIDAVRADHGRADYLLHAAGLEISRLLPDKKPEEFDLVFDVKADGWFNLLSCGLSFGTTLAFSSIAGRFGNGGQADYASANDLLCKLALAAPTGTRGLAIDWTAWGGIGMATRGSIPQVLAAAGIELLDPDAGLATIRRELVSGRGETVAAGTLGILVAERESIGPVATGPMLARVTRFSLYDGLRAEVELDPRALPFLDHHRIDGTAVLPGVMGVEAFVEAARALVPDAPTWTVEDVRFLAPFKLYRDAPRVVTVEALATRDHDDGTVVVDCRLLGHRVLHGQTEPEITEHFRGRVRFGVAPASATVKLPKLKRALDADAIYRVFFHGPAYRVLDKVARGGDDVVALLSTTTPDDGAAGAVAVPRALEAAFQAAGASQIAETGTMALPSVLARATWTLTGAPAAAVLVHGGPEVYDARVIDTAGHVILEIQGYGTSALGAIDPELRAPFSSALSR